MINDVVCKMYVMRVKNGNICKCLKIRKFEFESCD